MNNVVQLHRAQRITPGRYIVRSSRDANVSYSVQVSGERGVCDCLGYEGAHRVGNICRHIRECIAEERKHMETPENGTAVAVRDSTQDMTPMVLDAPAILPSMDELKIMVTIANSVYKTSGKLIPAEIKTSEEAFAIMLAGKELGIPPMASFREIFIVKGRTQPSARVLMGLVLQGDPGARFHWYERSATRAHVRLTRSNGMTLEVEYTIEDANRAGLTGNDVWKKFPADMLSYKAVSRVCRLGGPDLITGIGASTRHAPAVVAAVDEAIALDEDEIPELERSETVIDSSADRVVAPPAPPEQPAKVRLQRFLRDARATWDAPSFANVVAGINKAYPGALNAKGDLMITGKGQLDDETAQWILDGLAPQPPADNAPADVDAPEVEQPELI